jgi:ferric-dicitrate binding protein FerR (iron transport regulator)
VAQAQTTDQGYRVSEGKVNDQVTDPVPPAATAQPVATKRLARFDFVSGNVTWRADDAASWSKATQNLPLKEGAQIWVTDGGRAELRFDDGSLLRLGNNAVVTIQTVYSDAEGNFTQIKMTSGLLTMRVRQEKSVFQVDTAGVSVKAKGPARVRVGSANDIEVGVLQGQATVEGKQGKTVVHASNDLTTRDGTTPYDVQRLPDPDSWERWNDERDRALGNADGVPVVVAPRPVVVYPAVAPVYVPTSSFFLGLNFGFGPGWGYHHGYGWRGGWFRR